MTTNDLDYSLEMNSMSPMAKSATVMYEKVPKTFHIKRSTLPRIRMFDQMSAVNMRLDNDRTVAVSMGLG